jgi:hypothetical protein
MIRESQSGTGTSGDPASEEDEGAAELLPEDRTTTPSNVITDPGGGSDESPTTSSQEYLRVSALIPTRMVYSNEHERWRPFTEIAYNQSQTPYRRVDAWRVPIAGKTWEVGNGSPPDWVTKHVGSVSGPPTTHYVRLPGFLFIATSLDSDKLEENIPGNPSINFDGHHVVGVDLESTNTPGAHKFHAVLKLDQKEDPMDYLGHMELSLDVEEGSTFYDEITKSDSYQSGRISIKTNSPYGAVYTHSRDFGDALEQGFERLEKLYQVTSIAFLGFASAVLTAAQAGAAITFRLVLKETGEELVEDLIINYAWNEFKQSIKEPSPGDISLEDVRSARLIQGTTSFRPPDWDNKIGLTGPTLITKSLVLPHSIVIKGTGEEDTLNARYWINVSGELTAAEGTLPAGSESISVSTQPADEVTGGSAHGDVWSGADGYRFDGELNSLTVVPADGATVYVDGEQRSPDYTHSLVIQGIDDADRATYEITVSGQLRAVEGKLPVGGGWVETSKNENDEVMESTARGTVVSGADGFVFSGELESIRIDPPGGAKAYVDGKLRSSNRSLVIDGIEGGERATYEVEVTGDIQGYSGTLPAGDGTVGVGINDPDEIGEHSAEGTVTSGADGFIFSGEIKSLTVQPSDEANVYVDGNRRPVASFTMNPQTPTPGDTVTFDASGSRDPDGTIEQYEWLIRNQSTGDTDTATGRTVTRLLTEGDHKVTLTVTDSEGVEATTSTTVTVGTYPHTLVLGGTSAEGGSSYEFVVSGDIVQVEGTLEEHYVSINPSDEVQDNRVTGWVGGGADGFRYSGEITAFDIDNPTEAKLFIDGVQHDLPFSPNGDSLTAEFTVRPSSPRAGDSITFDGSESRAPEGSIDTYAWAFTDLSTYETETASGKIVEKSLSAATYDAHLTITADGQSATTEQEVKIRDPTDRDETPVVHLATESDGEPVGSPGTEIITATVTRGGDPVNDADVQFSLKKGDGTLAQTQAETGIDGTASVKYLVPETDKDAVVSARLSKSNVTDQIEIPIEASTDDSESTVQLRLSTDIDGEEVESAGGQDITAEVTRGTDSLSGELVHFVLEKGEGGIFPEQATTDDDGVATVTYRVPPTEQNAAITARLNDRKGVTDSLEIPIDSDF